jgi:hypothetical protein
MLFELIYQVHDFLHESRKARHEVISSDVWILAKSNLRHLDVGGG